MAGDPLRLAAAAQTAAAFLPAHLPPAWHQAALPWAPCRTFAADDCPEPRLVDGRARARLPRGAAPLRRQERSRRLADLRRHCPPDRHDLCRAPAAALDPAGQ